MLGLHQLTLNENMLEGIFPKGVLILSELAGASKELHQSLTVNPFDIRGLSASIHEAINMPEEEQQERNVELRERIRRYNVTFWSDNFLERLSAIDINNQHHKSVRITPQITKDIVEQYTTAKKRLLLLDYDGTLVKFHKMRNKALPTKTVDHLIH